MKQLSLTLLILVSLAGLSSCYKEIFTPESYRLPVGGDRLEIISFNKVSAFVDAERSILLYTLSERELEDFNPLVSFPCEELLLDGKNLVCDAVNRLGRLEYDKGYELLVRHGEQTDSYMLYFTPIPLLQLHTNKEIPSEPKIDSWMELQIPSGDLGSTNLFSSYAGVEIRGQSSTRFDKKAFGLELRDAVRNNRAASLLGMERVDDWVLDAMYIDQAYIRNKLGYELWEGMNGQAAESPVRCQHSEYVELFINDRYWGLYTLGEKVDRKFLDMEKDQDERGAVIYKTYGWGDGYTLLRNYHDDPPMELRWDGWEIVYPDNSYVWQPLKDFRQLVVQADDEQFTEEITRHVDLQNVADYFLLVNGIFASDNYGKNMYYLREGFDEPFYFLPWDLDASMGIDWQMEAVSSRTIVTNNELLRRLLELDVEGFRAMKASRWALFRADMFSDGQLRRAITERHAYLTESGALDRECQRWERDIDHEHELDYLLQWMEEHMQHMDHWLGLSPD